jgi:hypothetical protein
MISFDQFIEKWNGKPIDFDGSYGFQCMDLMHQYIYETLGITDRSVLAAPIARTVFEDFPNRVGNQYFDRIYNSLTAIPKDGDIIFWKEPYGYYYDTYLGRWSYAGHVGISKGSTLWNVTAFEQNNPAGTYCHMQKHSDLYRGVLGWLRLKTVVAPPYTEHQALVDIKGVQYALIDDSTARQKTKDILTKVGI